MLVCVILVHFRLLRNPAGSNHLVDALDSYGLVGREPCAADEPPRLGL